MKFVSTAILLTGASSASAFIVPSSSSKSCRAAASASAFPTTAVRSTSAPSETSSSDFGSSMPSAPGVYEKLGLSEEELAVGVKPAEVLEWLGTCDDLVTKFESDNPKFDRPKAEEEVKKFMMDAEMVNAYIAFEKRKADPRNLRSEAEQTLTDPSTWATYAAWIGGGAGFAAVKNLYIEPRYASGEWTDIHIPLPGSEFVYGLFHNAAADSVIAGGDAAAHVVSPDAVQSTLEGVAAVVNNAVTCVGDSCP